VTPAQGAFLVALGAAILLTAGLAWLVLDQARRRGGDPIRRLARLGRPSAARLEAHHWAFYAHRVSGAGIFAFLALHVVDVGLIAVSPELYDEVHALYGTPPLRAFEVVLLGGILFHAFNGLRLLVLDLFDVDARLSERLLWAAVAGTLVALVPSAAVILGPVLR
jgi:succinate dehydrogenase / fumarate reductase cytochrome b subunit